jgi:hypothetical protein
MSKLLPVTARLKTVECSANMLAGVDCFPLSLPGLGHYLWHGVRGISLSLVGVRCNEAGSTHDDCGHARFHGARTQ